MDSRKQQVYSGGMGVFGRSKTASTARILKTGSAVNVVDVDPGFLEWVRSRPAVGKSHTAKVRLDLEGSDILVRAGDVKFSDAINCRPPRRRSSSRRMMSASVGSTAFKASKSGPQKVAVMAVLSFEGDGSLFRRHLQVRGQTSQVIGAERTDAHERRLLPCHINH